MRIVRIDCVACRHPDGIDEALPVVGEGVVACATVPDDALGVLCPSRLQMVGDGPLAQLLFDDPVDQLGNALVDLVGCVGDDSLLKFGWIFLCARGR